LVAAGSPSARLDAELLLGKVTGWSRVELLAHPERRAPADVESAFQALVDRRAASEPIAYLLGEREFYGRLFKVDRRALIPRPETELLVDLGRAAVAHWRARGVSPVVVDVGTGAGAIAVSVAAECGLPVIGTDVSHDALALARENAFHHGVGVRLVQSDLLGGLRGPLHVVLANLPYVPRERALPPDVRDHEPAVALFGGQRGTELIERLLREAEPLLAPGAELAVELDEEEQAAPMAELTRQLYPSAEVDILQDNGGYDRVVRVLLSLPPAG
jgi:release factor glutamine methyltransferase